MLIPSASVNEALFTRLHQEIKDQDIAEFSIATSDRLGSAQTITVLDTDGKLFGDFQVYESKPGCFAVLWGDVEEAPPDPEAATIE